MIWVVLKLLPLTPSTTFSFYAVKSLMPILTFPTSLWILRLCTEDHKFVLKNSIKMSTVPQWRIQDFPQVGAWTLQGHIVLRNFPQNCMKLKEFGRLGGGGDMRPSCPFPLHPPMVSHRVFHPEPQSPRSVNFGRIKVIKLSRLKI